MSVPAIRRRALKLAAHRDPGLEPDRDRRRDRVAGGEATVTLENSRSPRRSVIEKPRKGSANHVDLDLEIFKEREGEKRNDLCTVVSLACRPLC